MLASAVCPFSMGDSSGTATATSSASNSAAQFRSGKGWSLGSELKQGVCVTRTAADNVPLSFPLRRSCSTTWIT